jgi:hypothetical protein
MRKIIGLITVPFLKLTGFRFSKDYRHGVTPFKAFVYKHVDTVSANLAAGMEL